MTTSEPAYGGTDPRVEVTLFDDGRLRVTRSTACTLTLSGEVDMSNSDSVRAVLDRVLADEGLVTLDLGRLTFVDLSGLRALGLMPGRRADPAVHVSNVPWFVQRLVNLLSARSGTV